MEPSRSTTLISRSAFLMARQDTLCAGECLGGHGAVSRDAGLAVLRHAASMQSSQSLTRISRSAQSWRARHYAHCAVAIRFASSASSFFRPHAACSATFAPLRVWDRCHARSARKRVLYFSNACRTYRGVRAGPFWRQPDARSARCLAVCNSLW